ncbi:hypothetical protein DL89DRAFT_309098 [Linderina pennispora]|uniref:Uncharacterized protein n=1 Tax=Linderina pennispora TaxID=61395 RepID=A0A1Y1WIP4_9FUNG|nr:uncharacterized protein DL89DRAFT_309098 [Linderina pennispora]ORX73086.1 hypothetical protein DL89DRAFT_309098 [Linderina pennispora]
MSIRFCVERPQFHPSNLRFGDMRRLCTQTDFPKKKVDVTGWNSSSMAGVKHALTPQAWAAVVARISLQRRERMSMFSFRANLGQGCWLSALHYPAGSGEWKRKYGPEIAPLICPESIFAGGGYLAGSAEAVNLPPARWRDANRAPRLPNRSTLLLKDSPFMMHGSGQPRWQWGTSGGQLGTAPMCT